MLFLLWSPLCSDACSSGNKTRYKDHRDKLFQNGMVQDVCVCVCVSDRLCVRVQRCVQPCCLCVSSGRWCRGPHVLPVPVSPISPLLPVPLAVHMPPDPPAPRSWLGRCSCVRRAQVNLFIHTCSLIWTPPIVCLLTGGEAALCACWQTALVATNGVIPGANCATLKSCTSASTLCNTRVRFAKGK